MVSRSLSRRGRRRRLPGAGSGFKGYKEYAKLVRAIGFTAADLPEIERPGGVAGEFLRYFRQAVASKE